MVLYSGNALWLDNWVVLEAKLEDKMFPSYSIVNRHISDIDVVLVLVDKDPVGHHCEGGDIDGVFLAPEEEVLGGPHREVRDSKVCHVLILAVAKLNIFGMIAKGGDSDNELCVLVEGEDLVGLHCNQEDQLEQFHRPVKATSFVNSKVNVVWLYPC